MCKTSTATAVTAARQSAAPTPAVPESSVPLEGVRPRPQWEERSGWSPATVRAGAHCHHRLSPPGHGERLRLPPEKAWQYFISNRGIQEFSLLKVKLESALKQCRQGGESTQETEQSGPLQPRLPQRSVFPNRTNRVRGHKLGQIMSYNLMLSVTSW